ncbi:MAG: hypothetical protein RIS09_1182 [Actinomycetota bacterium]
MDLYEYQAKELFAKHGVPITPGIVVENVNDAKAAYNQIGGKVVIKAQVKTGGRGKAGGVKVTDSVEDVAAKADAILGLDIKGHVVGKVLISEASAIVEEYYVSFLLDRANRSFLAMASVEGGMDIEEVAATKPEALARIQIDAIEGCTKEKAIEIATAAKFPEAVKDQVVEILQNLWQTLVKEDATLVEINPLAKLADGQVVALDGKMTLDDNARFRHPDHEALVDNSNTDPLELRAHELDLNYVKLEGQVGVIGNGAGLVMSTLDVVAYAGEEFGGVKPANFLDIGGGASAEVMANGLDIILHDPDVKSVFVNVFGGITACDAVANGILQAIELLESKGEKVTKPLICRIDGNNAVLGRKILDESGIAVIERVETMDEAARRVAEVAR